ncbi:EAL domain-containing protein [Roseibium sp.]|uniref:EAL domain-containing protein n=1 Tax=Roseibium sp. TaxID=1936156 RepID=UPI003A97E8AD
MFLRSGASGHSLKFIDTIERIGQVHCLIALQRSLALTLPLIMLGAIALLFRYPPLGTFGLELSEGYVQICNAVIQATFGIAALVALIGFAITCSQLHNQKHPTQSVNPAITAIVVLSCFFLTMSQHGTTPLVDRFSITNGLFAALFVSATSTNLFLRLARLKVLRLPLGPLGTDPLVGDVFLLLPASVLTVALYGTASIAFVAYAYPFLAMHAGALMATILAEGDGNLVFFLCYELLAQVLWFFSLHGPNLLHPVYDNLLLPATMANSAAAHAGSPPAYVFTAQFFDFFARMGGSGSTLCLIFALLFAGHSQISRRLALLALIPAVFNVNEPLLFGIPLVLNPVFLLPWLVTPLLQILLAYVAIAADFMPPTSNPVTWTTPVLINGYLSTGSIAGVLVQVLGLALGTLVYIPSVRLSERLARLRAEKLISRLSRPDLIDTAPRKQGSLLNINGAEGRMAIAMAHDLEAALARPGGLFLAFQPQIDVSSQTVAGAEALLRWEHPLYGPIPAPLIINLAEEIGCLDDLGLFVLETACSQYTKWRVRLPYDFTLSVNVSPHQLRQPDFVPKALQIISDAGIDPRTIELEVTESAALLPEQESVQALQELRKAGVRIALDDFGMGHTSLHYLRELPLDTIKVDRSLTAATDNKANELIVRSLLELGASMGIQILIEGVEEESQLERFTALGCTVFQGYLFSRPLSPEAFPAFVRSLMESRHLETGEATAETPQSA